MAADNKEQSTPDKATATPSVKVGSEIRSKRTLWPFRKKWPIYLLLLIVVLAGVWIAVSKELRVGEKVYAQAAGHKIYKQDVKDLIGDTPSISDHDVATVLADKYLTEAMGKEYDVSVSAQDMVNTYGQGANSQKSKYYYQKGVNNIYFRKLTALDQGIYKGKYLIANYSRNVAYPSPLLSEQKATDPDLGNPEAIARDKKYAKDFITKLYNQIKSGQMSFDQAIKAEHNNSEVGKRAYPTQPHSGTFDTSEGYGSVLTADVTKQKIKTIESGTLTKPFVAGTSSRVEDDTAEGSYYLVVQMDESKGSSDLSYEQLIKRAKEKYGYKVNV